MPRGRQQPKVDATSAAAIPAPRPRSRAAAARKHARDADMDDGFSTRKPTRDDDEDNGKKKSAIRMMKPSPKSQQRAPTTMANRISSRSSSTGSSSKKPASGKVNPRDDAAAAAVVLLDPAVVSVSTAKITKAALASLNSSQKGGSSNQQKVVVSADDTDKDGVSDVDGSAAVDGNQSAITAMSFRSMYAAAADGATASRHVYVFWDYENINFSPKQLPLFLAGIESFLRDKIRQQTEQAKKKKQQDSAKKKKTKNNSAGDDDDDEQQENDDGDESRYVTFSIVAVAPYHAWMDDKIEAPNRKTGAMVKQNKRMSGTALEILDNYSAECKVVPTKKKESADKKLVMDSFVAAVTGSLHSADRSSAARHICIISSDGGFAAGLRKIMNVPLWRRQLSVSCIHNLGERSAQALSDFESACGSENVHTVEHVMRKAAELLPSNSRERREMMLGVKTLPYGALWRERVFDMNPQQQQQQQQQQK